MPLIKVPLRTVLFLLPLMLQHFGDVMITIISLLYVFLLLQSGPIIAITNLLYIFHVPNPPPRLPRWLRGEQLAC